MPESFFLNKAAILDSLGGDEELFVELAQMFVDESASYCQNLKAALASGKPETLRGEAHTLKSLLATFADDEGNALAISVEQQAKNGLIDAEKTQELDARIQLLAKTLQQELG